MLFAKTAITGPNGEQVDRDQPIPASWPVDSDFVKEGIEHGWIISRDEPELPPALPATPPGVTQGGHRDAPPAAAPDAGDLDVGGVATREGTATA